MIYVPNAAPPPGKPRVFLAFEDRGRDLSGLLEFGTVVQVFPSSLRWQMTTETAPEFLRALRLYFESNQFTEDDFIAAVGDPIVITGMICLAALVNRGNVRVLKWDRLPCPECNTYRVKSSACPNHLVTGRYVPVLVPLPLAKPEAT